MDIKTINTPEKLHQAISKFLQSDYSHENLVETYNDALKCVARFRVDYLALPTLPRKDDHLYGLQDVMDWCNKSSKIVDDIISNLGRQTISKVISQLKILRDSVSRVPALVDNKLREQAQNEAWAKVENEYKNLNERASRLNVEEMPLTRRVNVFCELQQEQDKLTRRMTEDIVQIYLSKDPTFKDKLSQLHDEKINKAWVEFNKLIGSDTPTGKLFDTYCKLKDIPLQQQYDTVFYAYSLNDYTDMICDGCKRLYTSIDALIKTFEEIQTKAEQKPDLARTKESQLAKDAKTKKQRRKWVIPVVVALIGAVAMILVPFINWLLNSHSNKQSISLQENVSTSLNAGTKGNLSPAIVNSPNSTFNMNTYVIPSQSETNSENKETDTNRPK
jgi:hypothetical protein